MTQQTYQPLPGTVGHRVIEYMRAQPAGKRFTSRVLADAVGQPQDVVISSIRTAVKHGLIRREKGDWRVTYTLGDAEQPPAADTFDFGITSCGRVWVSKHGATVMLNRNEYEQLGRFINNVQDVITVGAYECS